MKENTKDFLLFMFTLPIIILVLIFALNIPNVDYITPLPNPNNYTILDDRYLGYLAVIELKFLAILNLIVFIIIFTIYISYIGIKYLNKVD